MASSLCDDSIDSISNSSLLEEPCSPQWKVNRKKKHQYCAPSTCDTNMSVLNKIVNRQLYGRFTKNPRAKTESLYNDISSKCKFKLDQIIPETSDMRSHVFMGFTLCSQYFITYTEKVVDNMGPMNFFQYEYDLYIWKFMPGQRLQFLTKHRIFKFYKGSEDLDEIMFMQFPSDPYKIICYGLGNTPVMAYITILTLPAPKGCKHCKQNKLHIEDNSLQGWCLKHGFILHYVFSMAQPTPVFVPDISLAYPDHLVINTGHYIHILNVSSYEPTQGVVSLTNFIKEETKPMMQTSSCTFSDCFSPRSESASDNFGTNSIVDAILEDFSEYDLEGGDCNKPFHELNISCEPLNVTGKSYHNALVQNIVDPRLKRLQNTSKDCLFSVPQTSGLQKVVEKSKIDKKTAEKAYEFIEENEKCEKLSSFRKKRLADKKYEFSEDNSENIVPFNSLRRDKRFFHRTQNRCIRSPDFNSTLFLSPRSPGMRSPMQSPNSRNGQFSPSGGRNMYCPVVRNSPHHSKSPISPKEMARKFNVYSPSLDSDCSDSDSKLILRHSNNFVNTHQIDYNNRLHSNNGLLIVDTKREDTPHWIKKVVRRYSSGDFENSSLVSGQSRDDYNIPIEIPLIIHTLTEQHLDVVPEYKAEQLSEIQLIITQRTFDCEQFVQRRAQKLCMESQLEFLHCEDYDIKLTHICPIDGHIVCQAQIKIGAMKAVEPQGKPHLYLTSCIFTWNIITDAFELIETSEQYKLQPLSSSIKMTHKNLTVPLTMCKKVLVMDYNRQASKSSLRDYNNCYEICMDVDLESSNDSDSIPNPSDGYSTIYDSDE